MACRLNAGFCKVGLVLVVGVSLFLWGCSSVPTDSIDPAEIEYQEIDAGKYCYQTGFKITGIEGEVVHRTEVSNLPGSQQKRMQEYYSRAKGYVLTEAAWLGAEGREEKGNKEVVLIVSGEDRSEYGEEQLYGVEVYATEYVKEIAQNDPTWLERFVGSWRFLEFNGHYKVWLYAREEDDGSTKVVVHKIEGVPTQEEIDAVIVEQAAEEEAAEAERIAQEEAKKRAEAEKMEKIEQLNARGRQLAKGYTFHGIEEDELNRKLFANGALEPGHAYLISGFVVQYGGSYAAIEYGDGFFFSSRSSSVIVSYASQQVKAEIINAGVTSLLGQTIETPLTVVVAAGTGYSGTPVVLGLVEE